VKVQADVKKSAAVCKSASLSVCLSVCDENWEKGALQSRLAGWLAGQLVGNFKLEEESMGTHTSISVKKKEKKEKKIFWGKSRGVQY
jgi:hypothetical protein